MKKTLAVLLVIGAALLGSLAFVGPAQAYPDTPPKNTTVVNNNVAPESVASPTTLPNTGGPNEVLLATALGLVLVGGVAVAATRRRAAE